MNKLPPPMLDLGAALSGRDAQMNVKKITDILTLEKAKLETAKRRGLDKAGFAANTAHNHAIDSALLIVNSVQLFHSAR